MKESPLQKKTRKLLRGHGIGNFFQEWLLHYELLRHPSVRPLPSVSHKKGSCIFEHAGRNVREIETSIALDSKCDK